MVNKLLSKLRIRELKKNAVSYLAMFFIVLLAVTLFLGFLSNSLTLDRRAELYYEEANLADLIVQTSSLTSDDREYLESIENAEVEYRVYSDGSFKTEGKDPQTAELYLYDGDINAAYITEGEEGFLIDARIAEMYGYEIGDIVTVEITSFKSVFSAAGMPYEYEFKITGLAHFVDRVNIYSVSAVYVTEQTLINALKEYTSYPEALIKSAISSAQNQALILCDEAADVKTGIEDYFAVSGGGNLLFVYDHDTMESVITIDSEIDQSLSMIYVFPVIFFVVALLVVMSTISRLILRERTNIGTMKALGIPDAKIIFHYAILSALVTLAGCIVGAIIGPLIVPNVMSIKYTLMFSMPQLSGIVVSIPWTLLTIAFVCFCAMAIAIWASRSVIKETPAECMRPRKIEYSKKEKSKKEEKTSVKPVKAEKEVSHTVLSCRMAVRNIRINWGRAIMTVIGVAGCSALLLTSFGIGDTLAQSVDNDLGKAFNYDVSSSFSSSNRQSVYDLLDDLKTDGKVDAYETVYTYNVPLSDTGETFTVYVFEQDSVMTTTTANGTAISQNKADDLGLSAGDTISFTAGGEKVVYTIEAVVQTSLMNGLFISDSYNTFGDGVYCSESVWIKTDNPDDVKETLNEVNGTLDAQTIEERIAEVNNIISSTNTMKYTLMVFAILLSVVVLYNLSLLNVKERTRDMATLKVLGYTHFQIALSLVLEIMLLTIAGIILGCIAGYPLLWLVMTINKISVIAFIITLKPISYVYSVLIAAGTAAVINVLFGFMITRIDMTESLKSVE